MIKYGIKNRSEKREEKNKVPEDRFQVDLLVEEGLSNVSVKARCNILSAG